MRTPFSWALLTAATLFPAAALAQDPASDTEPPPAPAAEPDAIAVSGASEAEPPATSTEPSSRRSSRLVEEVIVTAQKREERIQDVPIAITAFSAEKLDALGIQSAQDLERITPGLTITNAAGFNVAYLRGVGTDAFLPGEMAMNEEVTQAVAPSASVVRRPC